MPKILISKTFSFFLLNLEFAIDKWHNISGKRTIKPNKGKWSIPGGGFEKTDNSLFETAIRELREETGINLSNSVNEKKAIICSFHYPCFEWKTFMFEVASDFHVPERFCYEFSEIKFISLKDIHQYKLAFGVRKEIKKTVSHT